ncbi:hypothetical protein SH449x_001773 [Pirellulaceae bacterium SH449]
MSSEWNDHVSVKGTTFLTAVTSILMLLGCSGQNAPSSKVSDSPATNQSLDLVEELIFKAIDRAELSQLDSLLSPPHIENQQLMDDALMRAIASGDIASVSLIIKRSPVRSEVRTNSQVLKRAIKNSSIPAMVLLHRAGHRCDPNLIEGILNLTELSFYRRIGGVGAFRAPTLEDIQYLGEVIETELPTSGRLAFWKKLVATDRPGDFFDYWIEWMAKLPDDIRVIAADDLSRLLSSPQFQPSGAAFPFSNLKDATNKAKLALLSALVNRPLLQSRFSGELQDVGLEELDLFPFRSAEIERKWPALWELARGSKLNTEEAWVQSIKSAIENKVNDTSGETEKSRNVYDQMQEWKTTCQAYFDTPITKDSNGGNALTFALSFGRLDLAQWLVEHGGTTFKRPIPAAAATFLYIEFDEQFSDQELNKFLSNPASSKVRWLPNIDGDVEPYNPFFHAILRGSEPKLRRLLELRAASHAFDETFLKTIQQFAIDQNRPDIARNILLSQKLDSRLFTIILNHQPDVLRDLILRDRESQKLYFESFATALVSLARAGDLTRILEAFDLYWLVFDLRISRELDADVDFATSFVLLKHSFYESRINQPTNPELRTLVMLEKTNAIEAAFKPLVVEAIKNASVLEHLMNEGVPVSIDCLDLIVKSERLDSLRVLLANRDWCRKYSDAIQNSYRWSVRNEKLDLANTFQAFGQSD